ncbi:hypothetical protein C8R47DRAFT_1090530 [Mycena vitilis]|nr:hypothetical protein C8R47DRAFT_1090530 [Mycena vitilis]
MDAASTDPQGGVAPLPTLRTPTAASTTEENEVIAPLPALRAPRAATPAAFEPEDESLFVRKETPYDAAPAQNTTTADESVLLQNPVVMQETHLGSGLPPPSTDRSMVGQTMRSFENRTGTSHSVSAAKTNTISRGGSSSNVIMFGDVAPSELEIYSQAGLIATPKGAEKVGDHRIRTDENELRIGTHIVAILRRIKELEERVNAQIAEMLMRMEDILSKSPATSSTTLASAFGEKLSGVRAMTMEGRAAIGELTAAVNGMVDLPREVASLSRTVLNLMERTHPAHTNGLSSNVGAGASNGGPGNYSNNSRQFNGAQYSTNIGSNASSSGATNYGNNRAEYTANVVANAPSGGVTNYNNNKKRNYDGADASSSKRPKTFCDVWAWNVKPDEMPIKAIAHRAVARLGMNTAAVLSVQHPHQAPNSVISLRFASTELAEEFIDRHRSNPTESMNRLHVGKPGCYEKHVALKNTEKDPW